MRQVELEKYKFDRLYTLGVIIIALLVLFALVNPLVIPAIVAVAGGLFKWLGPKSGR